MDDDDVPYPVLSKGQIVKVDGGYHANAVTFLVGRGEFELMVTMRASGNGMVRWGNRVLVNKRMTRRFSHYDWRLPEDLSERIVEAAMRELLGQESSSQEQLDLLGDGRTHHPGLRHRKLEVFDYEVDEHPFYHSQR